MYKYISNCSIFVIFTGKKGNWMKDSEEKFTSPMLNMAALCHLWLEGWIKYNLENFKF